MKRSSVLNRVVVVVLACVMLVMAGCQNTPSAAPPASPAAAGTSIPAVSATATPEPAKNANFNPTGYPIVNEKITVTVSGERNPLCASWKDLIMVKEIEEDFGIVFECKEYATEEWKVQKGLIFASNDLPDLFLNSGLSLAEVADYGGQGFFAPMNDLIDKYGVNTKVVFGKNDAMEKLCTSPDGNIYTLVTGSAIPANMANRNWINAKWIEAVGKKYPKTLDELYELFQAFAAQDLNGNKEKDEIPVTGRVLDEIVLNALGMPVKSYSGLTMIVKDGKPTAIAADERYKAYLEWMRKFYADGLLDSATFIQTTEEHNAKIAQGRVGAYAAAAPWLFESKETAFDFVYFGGLISAQNSTPMVGASNGLLAVGNVLITTKNPYPAECFRLLDYFYSDEGSTYGFIGKQGIGWDWVDESAGTWKRVMPAGWTDTDEAFRVGKLTLATLNIYRDTEWKLFKPTGNNVWLYDAYTEGAVPYFTDIFPVVLFTEEEQKKLSSITTDLNSYISDAVARFVLGETDLEAGWGSFQSTLKTMGIDDVMKINADAYNRYMGL